MAKNGSRKKLRNGLTPKENALKNIVLKQIEETGDINGTEAALQVYDTTDRPTASAIASEVLNKPLIRDALEQALTANDVTSEGILKNINGLAQSSPQKITGETVLKANLSLLKLLGHDGGGKKSKNSLTVHNTVINIGYDEAKEKLRQIGSDADRFIQEADIS